MLLQISMSVKMTPSVTTWRAVNVTTLSEAMTVCVQRAMSAVNMHANVRTYVHFSISLLMLSLALVQANCAGRVYSLVSTVSH